MLMSIVETTNFVVQVARAHTMYECVVWAAQEDPQAPPHPAKFFDFPKEPILGFLPSRPPLSNPQLEN